MSVLVFVLSVASLAMALADNLPTTRLTTCGYFERVLGGANANARFCGESCGATTAPWRQAPACPSVRGAAAASVRTLRAFLPPPSILRPFGRASLPFSFPRFAEWVLVCAAVAAGMAVHGRWWIVLVQRSSVATLENSAFSCRLVPPAVVAKETDDKKKKAKDKEKKQIVELCSLTMKRTGRLVIVASALGQRCVA